MPKVITDLVFRVNAADRIVDFYASEANNLYSISEGCLGKPYNEVVPPESTSVLERCITGVRMSDGFQRDEYSLAGNGTMRRFEVRLLPYKDDILVIVSEIARSSSTGENAQACAAESKDIESKLARSVEISRSMYTLLDAAHRAETADELLMTAVRHLTSLKLLNVKNSGAAFLLDEEKHQLVMRAQHNLPVPVITKCARVPLGHCLCGLAAVTGELQYASCIDDRHETCFDGMTPHGHYVVPINIEDKCAAVVVLYLALGEEKNEEVVEFLCAAADVLAGALQRVNAKCELKASNELLAEGLEPTSLR
jgi:hypothetical protein